MNYWVFLIKEKTIGFAETRKSLNFVTDLRRALTFLLIITN